ncbi:hypothetical protein BDR06DRAFT_488518 [Suillus hirtellus]|nr:hypothetical protein BDR06DRAFT_488518 [Suillus hirtellus]
MISFSPSQLLVSSLYCLVPFPSDFDLFKRYLVVSTPYLCFMTLPMTRYVCVILCLRRDNNTML